MPGELKLMIGLSVYDKVHLLTATSLANLAWHTGQNVPEGTAAFAISIASDSHLARGRCRVARAAVENDFTHLFLVDADMTLPPDTLHRLLAHDKDIVGVNALTRRTPHHPTAIIRNPEDNRKYRYIHETEKDKGLMKVDSVGMAVCLIKVEIFKNIAMPWFFFPWSEEMKDWDGGEDGWFCLRAGEAGYEVWVDHDLSRDVNHMGEVAINWSGENPYEHL